MSTDRTSMDDLTELMARAMHARGAWCGVCGYEGGWDACAECRRTCFEYADAALDSSAAWFSGRGLLLGPDGLLRAEFEEMGGVRGDVPLYAHEAVT